KIPLSAEELGVWYASISNYAYWAERFKQTYLHGKIDAQGDLVLGQDNKLLYKPRKKMCLRIQDSDKPLDIFRSIAAAISCHTSIEISWTSGMSPVVFNDQWKHHCPTVKIKEETQGEFLQRLKNRSFERVRLLSDPTGHIKEHAAASNVYLCHRPVLSSGRFELLHYLREMALSIDYHRYGNLGVREGEHRNPIL
ncbi:MAG: proline dehydrogenase, partial [Chlamydiia bacterium]|nr:proline dehydrogenase [Chlamydiia bacterium]